MTLYRLVYASQAIPNLGYADLADILTRSERNNASASITGMLCYGNGMFLQLLEGNRPSLSTTYHRIAQDPRHHSPELIYCAEVTHRHFTDWGMKVVDLNTNLSGPVQRVLTKHSPSFAFSPQLMSDHQCLNLLLELQALYQPIST